MPIKVKNDAGEEIEVYTADELEEQRKTAAEEALKDAPKKEDLEKAQADLAAANKKLETAAGTDEEKARLQKERDEALAKYKEIDEKVTSVQKTISSTERDTDLDGLAKGDKDIRSKIEHFYNTALASMPETTRAERIERMAAAAQLATGTKPSPNIFDSFSGSGGSRGTSSDYGAGGKEPSENSKNIGKAFGIKDEDLKKYEGRSAIK